MPSASNDEIQKLQKNNSDVLYANLLNLSIEHNKACLKIINHYSMLSITKGLNKRINSEMLISPNTSKIQKLQKNDSDIFCANLLNLCIEHNKACLKIINNYSMLSMTKGLNKRINSEMLISPNTSKIQKLDQIPNEQKNPIILNENDKIIIAQNNEKHIADSIIDEKTKTQMDSFDVLFFLIKFFQKSKRIEYTSLPLCFKNISQNRRSANFDYYEKGLMLNEMTSEICFDQNKESKINTENPKKDTNDKIQNINQNIMQPIDVINDSKDCGLFNNRNDNFTNYAINDCLLSLNCVNACHNDKIVKINCNLVSNSKDSEFPSKNIFYKMYKFILDYENETMKKISNRFYSEWQEKFELDNEIETEYIIRKVNFHLPNTSKKSKRKQYETQNEYIKKAIFVTLNYNGIDYIRNDFLISEIEPLETFFELNIFNNLQFTDYVKSILNIDAFVDVNFNTKSSYFFSKNCLDIIKLIIFSDKYLSNGIENSAANWEMVYDKICSVFEAKNTGIKYVFQ
ncbi:hypothetical protein GVAV_002982 [Gurleya vavrai]